MYHYKSRCCGGPVDSDIPREDFIIGECPACGAVIDGNWYPKKLFPTVDEYEKDVRFEFTVIIAGEGKNADEAYEDAFEGYSVDQGCTPADFLIEEM